MVYGQPLVVPGEFFPRDETVEAVQIERLRRVAGDLAPCRPTRRTTQTVYVPNELKTCKFVFIREGGNKPSLSPAYRGPYSVLKRNDKSFLVDLLTRSDWVSIDRLKPAYIDIGDLSTQHFSRSGRQIKVPKRFQIRD